MKTLSAFAWVLLISLSVGCATFEVPKSLPWFGEKQETFEPPVRIDGFWTSTRLDRPGRDSVRGFSGRVMLYGAKSSQPIRGQGKLIVYAYDEAVSSPQDGTPSRKYEFAAADLEKHYSQSKLGPSYSFWLPWDKAGGESMEITLIACFVPDEGRPTASEPTRNLLRGVAPLGHVELNRQTTGSPTAGRAVRQAGFQQAASGTSGKRNTMRPDEKPRRTMQTHTINIPPGGMIHARTPRRDGRVSWGGDANGAGSRTSAGPPTALQLRAAKADRLAEQSQQSHSERGRSPVREAPTARRDAAGDAWRDYRGGWPSARKSRLSSR